MVYGIVHRLRQTVGAFSRSLYRFGGSSWVCKPPTACFRDKGSQFFHVSISQVVHCFETLHERNGGSAGVLDVLVLGHAGAFQKQIVGKPLFLAGHVLNGVKSGFGKDSEDFVAVIVHVDLSGNSAETEMVSDHEGVHPVVLG